MNTLYHIAILEGYLAQHPELPRNVQDAIAHLKQQAVPAPVQPVSVKKKRRKMTPEERQANLERLAKARDAWKAKRAAVYGSIDSNTVAQIHKLRSEGKTRKEIAAEVNINHSQLDKVLYK